jgi:hypothetical protein
MDKIMSAINDTWNLGHATLNDHSTLADTELAAVTGGVIPGLAPIYAQIHADMISACVDGLVSGVGLPKGK